MMQSIKAYDEKFALLGTTSFTQSASVTFLDSYISLSSRLRHYCTEKILHSFCDCCLDYLYEVRMYSTLRFSRNQATLRLYLSGF